MSETTFYTMSKLDFHVWICNTHLRFFFPQLQQFRNVKEEDEGESPESLVDNFRPVQPLHGRVIEISGNSAAAVGPTVVAMVGLAALAFFYWRTDTETQPASHLIHRKEGSRIRPVLSKRGSFSHKRRREDMTYDSIPVGTVTRHYSKINIIVVGLFNRQQESVQ